MEPRYPRIFLSCSFSEEDKPVVRQIERLLQSLGLEVSKGQLAPWIPDSIIDFIKASDILVAVLTQRTGSGTPHAVTFEIGAAMAANKDVIVFRENSVDGLKIIARQYQHGFDRKSVEAGDKDTLEELKEAMVRQCHYFGFEVGGVDPQLDLRFTFAKERALEIGSKVLAYFRDTIFVNEVRNSAIKNYSTEADNRVDALVREAIKHDTVTTADGIISEESRKDAAEIRGTIEKREFVWVVDSLDGTLNFAYGFPFFCVSIGLLRRGVPVIGVIYNPSRQELYLGRAGRVSEVISLAEGTRRPLEVGRDKSTLGDCMVMTHLSASDSDARGRTIGVLDKLSECCRGIRMLGSGQMALVSVALGQFDAFLNYKTSLWDIAPGYVILRGAGGYATTLLEQDEGWSWESRGIIAASSSDVGGALRRMLEEDWGPRFPRL